MNYYHEPAKKDSDDALSVTYHQVSVFDLLILLIRWNSSDPKINEIRQYHRTDG